ncbi:MAG: diguanylate cyclase [Burkholderiaceae bacterium]|nr:diguanylate cyclase [Burkholderiaceae bacterium]
MGSSSARLLLAAALLAAALLVILWMSLQLAYRAEVDGLLESSTRSTQKLASRTTEVLDRVLHTSQLIQRLRDSERQMGLKALAAEGLLPSQFAKAILVTDRQGLVIDATGANLALSLADEEYFKRLAQGPPGATDIGPTEFQPALEAPALPVSQRIDDGAGRFMGVVTALIPPWLLTSEYAGSEATGTAVSLVGTDGVVRARLLGGKLTFGEKVDVSRVNERVSAARSLRVPVRSSLDGKERFVIALQLERYPLLAVVAVDADQGLVNYRKARLRLLLWAAGFGALLGLGTWLLLRQLRRVEVSKKAQHQAEEHLRAALEGSLDAISILLALRGPQQQLLDFQITDANKRAAEMIGLPLDQMLGRRLSEVFPAMRSSRVMDTFAEVITTREASTSELLATLGVMKGRWLHQQVVAVGDGVALISRDITDRKLAERNLDENRRFLQNLLDFLPLPVYAKSMHPDGLGVYEFWNHAAERSFHMPAAQVVGRTVRDLYAPADAQRFDDQDLQVLRDGKPRRFPSQVFNGPEGRRYFDTFKAPVLGADGEMDHLLVIAEDVTERRAYAERLVLASKVIAETADAVVVTDAEDRVIDVNRAFSAMTGRTLAQVEHRPATEAGLPPVPDFARLTGAADGQRWVGEAHLALADGQHLDIWLSTSRIVDEDGHTTHHARVFSDISILKGHEKALQEMARRDSLTGLPNRRHFDERLAESLRRFARTGPAVTLMFIDLDGFKKINDELGHEAGDQLLIEVARRLGACVRGTDLVFRLGGDEFTLLLEDAGGTEALQTLCQRIVEALSKTHLLGGHEAVVTPSIGVACALPGESPDTLCRRADQAMYEAKRGGKGTYRIAD